MRRRHFDIAARSGRCNFRRRLRRSFRAWEAYWPREFELRGLFGVDAILQGERIYPLEVNPRYTASVEILERCYGYPAIELHIAGCSGVGVQPFRPQRGRPKGWTPTIAGKSIVYATADSIVPAEFSEWAGDQNRGRDWPQIADIPPPGTTIPAGRPICTVLADGGTIGRMWRNGWIGLAPAGASDVSGQRPTHGEP